MLSYFVAKDRDFGEFWATPLGGSDKLGCTGDSIGSEVQRAFSAALGKGTKFARASDQRDNGEVSISMLSQPNVDLNNQLQHLCYLSLFQHDHNIVIVSLLAG